MKKELQHLVIPISIACITAAVALLGAWDDIPVPRSINQLAHDTTSWMIIALAAMCIIQACLAFLDKLKEDKRASFELRLRREFEPEISTESKYLDPKNINGLFTLRVDQNDKTENIIQRQVCFEEMTSGCAELTYKDSYNSHFTSVDSFRCSKIRLIFEPSERSFWTRNLYDRDDLKENIKDARPSKDGTRQVLIYTKSMEARIPELLTRFADPGTVLKICRHGVSPRDEMSLPEIFRLINNLSIYVNQELILQIPLEPASVCHHFAIGAVSGDGPLRKFSLYYAAEIVIEIDKSGSPTMINWEPDQSVIDTHMQRLLYALKTEDGAEQERALMSIMNSAPRGFDI